MQVIPSAVNKDKAAKKTVYSFNVNNEYFEAHYVGGKKAALELFHNGTSVGVVDKPKEKFDFTVDSDSGQVKFTLWMETNPYAVYIGKLTGIGIEANGIPVQYTLADSDTYVKNGRVGLYFLVFIFAIKSVFTYLNTFKEYMSSIVAGITAAIYFVPLLLLLLMTVKYKAWTKAALIYGMIVSVLEMVDYAIAIPNSIAAGVNGASMVIWILLRICAFCILVNAFRWKLKQANNMTRPTN